MAVSYLFTIGAVAKFLQPGWRISETLNGRNTMTGRVSSGYADHLTSALIAIYRPTVNNVIGFSAYSTVTITNASPGVVTWTGHGLINNNKITLSTTGALPTGLSVATTYYLRNKTANTFELSATFGGASINTSSSGSGVHTATRTLFNGIIYDIEEEGLGGMGVTPISVGFGATDYNIYAERKQIEISFPAQDLNLTLDTIEESLLQFGVAIHSGQAAYGSALDALTFELGPISAILDKLSLITGWAWEIDYDKKLRMAAPGTESCPFDITSGDGNVLGDIKPKPSLSNYANYIIGMYTESARKAYAFLEQRAANFTAGDTTIVGSTYTWRVAASVAGEVTIGTDANDSLVNFRDAINGDALNTVNGSVNAWLRYPNQLQVTALDAGTSGNSIAVGGTDGNQFWYGEGRGTSTTSATTLSSGADDELSNRVIADGGAAPADVVEKVIQMPEIRDQTTAQNITDGYLARSETVLNETNYLSHTPGARPNFKQSIVEAKRNLNSANFLITDVEIFAEGNLLQYNITVVDTLIIPHSLKEFYKEWGGSGGGSSSTVVSGGGGGGSSTGAAEVYVSLGGSDSAAISFAASPAYTSVINSTPFFAKTSFTGKVRVWLWSRVGGVTVTARLYDVTDAAAVGSVGTTGTSRPASPQTFNVVITTTHQYRLDILSSVASEDCYGIGTLETL